MVSPREQRGLRTELDTWAKPDLEAVRSALGSVENPWWIAGGIALDLFVGREIRPHHDVDVAILATDVPAFRRELADWDIRAAVGWSGEPQRSTRLLRSIPSGDPVPSDIGALWCRPAPHEPWAFELLLSPSSAERWQFKRDPGIELPVSRIGGMRDGVPFLIPEIVLLHKATSSDFDERDTSDFREVRPMMAPEQRAWLAAGIDRFDPRHPWLSDLD